MFSSHRRRKFSEYKKNRRFFLSFKAIYRFQNQYIDMYREEKNRQQVYPIFFLFCRYFFFFYYIFLFLALLFSLLSALSFDLIQIVLLFSYSIS